MIFTALIMGFAGSLHCVGMCSPLAMAVSNLTPAATLNRLIYNLGRILTYGMMGAIAGSLGWMLPFSGFPSILSVIMGLVMLIIALTGVRNIRIPILTKALQNITAKIKLLFSSFLQSKNYTSVFLLGILNGLLPCGLTFLALTYTLTLGNTLTSFYYMLLFGAGTLPVMFGLTTIFQLLVKRFNLNFRKVTTAMLVVSGFLLIARVFVFNQAHATPAERHVIDIVLCR